MDWLWRRALGLAAVVVVVVDCRFGRLFLFAVGVCVLCFVCVCVCFFLPSRRACLSRENEVVRVLAVMVLAVVVLAVVVVRGGGGGGGPAPGFCLRFCQLCDGG